jgi:PAS domain S-box-containing protein
MKLTKALRYAIIFGVTGVLTISFLFYSHQRLIQAYNQHSALTRVYDIVSSRLSNSSLQYQRFATSEHNDQFQQQVVNPVISARNLLQGIYDGSETEIGSINRPNEEDFKAALKETIFGLEKLASQYIQQDSPDIEEDSASVNTAGNGSNYLTIHDKVQKDLQRLQSVIQEKTERERGSAITLLWLSALLTLVAFTGITFVMYRLQHVSDKIVYDNALKLKEESTRVNTLSGFVEAVSAGNYNMQLESSSTEDNLTSMLINMRDKLKQNAEDDRKRNWATTGLARIGEILRVTTMSSSELYDNIIKFVVKYTNSSQGGLFLLNDESETERYLELVACYAFERKKFLQRRVEIGDGLVGQCFLEGERIVLFEVPQEYISITSGLGGSNPNALLIVPMRVNENVYGVIELASFNRYEEYEVELVEKLAESIASTISNVRVNETTRILLEKTQQQAEEMKSQEEEIRQNMEELEATQEEMRRKQTILEKELDQSQHQAEVLREQERRLTESQETLQVIVDNIPRAIFWKDKDLRFMGCNKIFAEIAGVSSYRDLIGKSDYDMAWSAQADAYRRDDMEVMQSRKAKLEIEEVNVNSDGEESWVLTSKVPIVNTQNEVVAILGMFEDITQRKRQEADIARKLKERETVIEELQRLKQVLEQRK